MIRKFQITDAKSGVNSETGKIDMSLYINHAPVWGMEIVEAQLLLSLLGGYNKHGRQFDLEKFNQIEKQFYELISQAEDILI